MAEIVVNFVINKLAESLIEEARFLGGVADKDQSLTHELEWIKAFLEDADSKSNKDARVKRWVNDVKEVSYLIEDTFDMYFVKMNAISKQTFRRIPKKIIAKHKLGAKIDKIRARISEIKDFRANYGVPELKESTDSGLWTRQQMKGQLAIPEIDEDVVGLKDAVEHIIKKLTNGSISSRFALSIVGQGGLGKTTLAKKVYISDNVQSHFDQCIWVSISAEFELIKILKNIIEKDISNSLCEKGLADLIRLLHDSLKEKKYLIVLDDIWENNSDLLLEAIQKAFPESNNGSRVLITTRFVDVAKKLDISYDIFKLVLLNEQESLELLLKKACRNCNCPDNLLPLAQKLSKKCAGLPIALVVLGGQLSMTDLNFHSWNMVMQRLDWNDKDTRCMDAISTSYQVLSLPLKQCFLYLALYPEDYEFKANDLTRLWVAEGFITQNESSSKTMEDTADEYLKELVQRCLVQVSKKSVVGNIKSCQLHDLIREFLIPKAREENIFMVLSGTKTSYSCNNLERRVVILSPDVQTENISSNIRSLLVVGQWVPARINCSIFKLLRVLDFGAISSGPDKDGRCLVGLTNLRYLKCDLDRVINPSYLTCLNNLQMVIVNLNDEKSSLPESFWDFKMLRYVILGGYNISYGPPSKAKLNNLLTLGKVAARGEWSSKLPHFPRLRKLNILIIDEEFEWEPFTQKLCVLEELKHFSCLQCTEFPVLHLTPAFANFKYLQRLDLDGEWPEEATSDLTMLPPNLVRLTLGRTRLKKDPLPELEKLQHLQELNLFDNMYVGRTMACSNGGFLCLQKLYVTCCNIDEWNIEDGAMRNINWLKLYKFENLQMVPNFQHLTNLRELKVEYMSPQFNLKLEGEDRYKVNHIPFIKKRY